MKGYCLRERKKNVTMANVKLGLNANGSPVARGECPNCKCNMVKILSADEVPADLRAKSEAFKKSHAGKSRKSKKGSGSKRSRKSKKGGKSRKSKGSRKSK